MDKMGLVTIPDIKTDSVVLFNNNNNNKSIDYEIQGTNIDKCFSQNRIYSLSFIRAIMVISFIC
jgi:hypothetical protein